MYPMQGYSINSGGCGIKDTNQNDLHNVYNLYACIDLKWEKIPLS